MEELTVVSIHLGAAFSTFAYGKAGAREWETCVVQPTSLYYVKNNASSRGESDSEAEYGVTFWGWGAKRRHDEDLAGEGHDRNALYVANFMSWGHLASSRAPAQGLWQGEQKFATPGDIPQGLSLITVISDYLRLLAGFAVYTVNVKYSSNIKVGDIQWCFTVPSIWDDSALKTLRQNVEWAGMVKGPFCPPQAAARASAHPLLFVLEWEAAALSCFRGVSMEEGSEVLGVDVGSDTTNIVILKEHQGGFVLVEGRSADGCCISDVDKSFYDMLRARIGSACFDDMERQNPAVGRDLQEMWEALRSSYGEDGELPQTQTLQIPWEAYDRGRDNVGEHCGKIEVDMKLILDPVAERIIHLTQEQLSRPDVKGLFLMGESSPYLGLKMKAAFGTKFGDCIMIPPDPRCTMCQGAVTFGLSPALQASRRTYELTGQRPCSLFDSPKLDVWTALERVREKRSEFDESLRSCLEAIHMTGIEAIHSENSSETLVASV